MSSIHTSHDGVIVFHMTQLGGIALHEIPLATPTLLRFRTEPGRISQPQLYPDTTTLLEIGPRGHIRG